MLATRLLSNKVIYNHGQQSNFQLNTKRPVLDTIGRLIGFRVKGISKHSSAVYSVSTICDLLDMGSVTLPNGLSLEIVN
jgi:hypothetical protein